MTSPLRRLWALPLVALLMAGACGGGSGNGDPIPADLAEVESAAEAGFDAALSVDRAQIGVAASQAGASWSSYQKRAPGDGAPADALRAVDTALAQVGQLAAAQASGLAIAHAFNAISVPMARLYAAYSPPVPATLLDLDVMGRALVLDARAADMARAAADLETLAATWAAFRPRVLAAKASTEAAALDASLADARKAIAARNGAALEVAAVAETEGVDLIEKVFADLAHDGAD